MPRKRPSNTAPTKKTPLLKRLLKIPFWLVFGLISFLGVALYGAYAVFDINSPIDSLYGAIDWFAAAIPYFFLAAIFGHITDWAIRRFAKKKIGHPLWFLYTLALWAIGTISAFNFVAPKNGSEIVMFLFFPFVYGVFFPAFTYLVFFPDFVKTTLYGKIVLDAIYLLVFGAWLALEWRRIYGEEKSRAKLIRNIMLALIFAVLFIGMASCIASLPR